jgi:hypothetical protein
MATENRLAGSTTRHQKDHKTMATRRAQPDIATTEAPAPKASKTKAEPTETKPKFDADGNKIVYARRVMGDRNWLAREIDRVLRAADGSVTVHDIVLQITNKAGEHPSSGAVAAALKRWSEQGYITVNPKPLAFKSFPAKWKNGTFADFEVKNRESRLTARRAAKAAA